MFYELAIGMLGVLIGMVISVLTIALVSVNTEDEEKDSYNDEQN